MKKNIKKLIPALLSVFICGGMATGIAACGHEHDFQPKSDASGHWTECRECEVKTDLIPHADDDNDGKCDECEYVMTASTTVAVTGITLDESSVTLEISGTKTLNATVAPSNATNRTVTWTSSDAAVATVDQTGKITAIAAGTATITATAGNQTATCVVTVNPASNPAITAVKLTETELTLNPNDERTLTALVFGESTADKTVTWASSNDAVATVDQTGKVKAVAAGAATITATAGGKSATCAVTVEEADAEILATEVTLDQTTGTLTVGDFVTLTPTVKPQDTTNKTVTWTSSNTAVAVVDAFGKISALEEGTATITATTSNGKKAEFALTVITASSTQSYTVTYIDGTKTVKSGKVLHGTNDTPPVVSKDGSYFGGWYDNPSFNGKAYNFNTPISGEKVFYAKWIKLDAKLSYTQAGFEAAAFEWTDTNADAATVEYKLTGENTYATLDSELIRNSDNSTVRADVIGLKGGEEYDFKITTSAGDEIEVPSMQISAYDRSGYAHFNYTDGVGAYNDDGTLKDNALVIYLTESNKNDILDFCYVNGTKVDISQYMKGSNGTQYSGIGELLNNRRYSGNDRMNVGIAKLSQVYGGVNIRVIGKVEAEMLSGGLSSITGLTDYNSTGNGGSEGDDGRMARITNAKNLTIEGIGEDAKIYGWGIHFINSDTLHQYDGAGKNFEARNLTFERYPEDAIGMEGVQSGKLNPDGSNGSKSSKVTDTLYAPVERCWVHNNTFLPGFCANPAESDKKDGDGSCDFKRGQYFTCSYNKFEDCHKTNLVGANGQTLQYNLSYHHNYWYNCKARQPLARNANIHYYNNFIQYTTDTVMSVRSDCYLFAEANYFEGCKNPTEDTKDGVGTIKLFNNTFYACYEFKGGNGTFVSKRNEYISNNCQYIAGNIKYDRFDTNPDQFYYDAENNTSDCYITDSVTARKECILYSGIQKRDYESIKTNFNKYTPTTALSIPKDGFTVDLSKVGKSDSTVDGIVFTNITGVASGTIKGKGQIATFTLAERADITITATKGSEDSKAELLRADGTMIAAKFESFTGTLEAGTYVISSGQVDASGTNTKEVTLNSLSFKSGVTDDEKVQNVINYINAIGTVELTQACNEKITTAKAAYDALGSALQLMVTNADVLANAVTQYNSLVVAPVVQLISAIGTVNENSGDAISEARKAYNALTVAQKAAVTNYATLTAAEVAYSPFVVTGLNNQIANLAAPSTATTREAIVALLDKYEAARDAYEGLGEEQVTEIVNYNKVTSGISALEAALKPYELKDMLAELPESNAANYIAKVGEAKKLYDSLDSTQKAVLTADEKTKIEAAIEAYNDYLSKAVKISFTPTHTNYYTAMSDYITASSYAKKDKATTYDDVNYTQVAYLDSSATLTIKQQSTARKMVIHFFSANAIYINDTKYVVSGTTLTIELEANTDYVIKKGDGSNNFIFMIELLPA